MLLNLDILGNVEAYLRLEQTLKKIGFDRATNEESQGQHFRSLMDVGNAVVVAVDLLCDDSPDTQSRVIPLPGERRLSALKLPGANLVALDSVEVRLTAELLTNGAIATETVQIANVVPFLVLKALAYEERVEEKDAHDLLYCLMYYRSGPSDVAREFVDRIARWSDTSLLFRALDILAFAFCYRRDRTWSTKGWTRELRSIPDGTRATGSGDSASSGRRSRGGGLPQRGRFLARRQCCNT